MCLIEEDRLAIEGVHGAWLNAELRGDWPALPAVLHSGACLGPPNEAALCGRTAILDWLEDQPVATVRRIVIDDLAISGLGGFAWKLPTFPTTVESVGRSDGEVVTGAHGWLLQRDDTRARRIAVVAWTIGAWLQKSQTTISGFHRQLVRCPVETCRVVAHRREGADVAPDVHRTRRPGDCRCRRPIRRRSGNRSGPERASGR